MKKHPSALPYLFLSEMWERFGFYLMLGILYLYMRDSEKGSMGMDNAEESDIFGTYIALVYLTPFVGGLLADRIMGYRLSTKFILLSSFKGVKTGQSGIVAKFLEIRDRKNLPYKISGLFH